MSVQPGNVWRENAVFVEIGVQNADLAKSLRHEGYERYLGVSRDSNQIAAIQAEHEDIADSFISANRRRLVRRNNAEVLILSGISQLHVWRYRSVRHAESVTWQASLNPLSIFALLGCLLNMLARRYSWPKIVCLRGPDGNHKRMFVINILRRKAPGHAALHFIPYHPGITGLFQAFDEKKVRYVVLRWFDSLPSIKPDEDVDLLVADESLEQAFEILNAQPGIQPCDVYSERGLARSDFSGTPYYPAEVAEKILGGAVRHNDLCMVPNPYDYFHALAYHAVYHKGFASNLPVKETDLLPPIKAGHDFPKILKGMSDKLGIQVDISLEGLHTYLQESGWGPPPEMLARLAVACKRNRWLQTLASRLDQTVHDQGLAVFVVRQEAVQRGYTEQINQMIRDGGFTILASKKLASEAVKAGAAQTRGGNWRREGPFELSGGPPGAIVVAYDHAPRPLTRRQLRKFPERTNSRIFIKEEIREAICSDLPSGQRFNAIHSSDHAAEAWHLIEVLAPELLEVVRERLPNQPKTVRTDSHEVRRAA